MNPVVKILTDFADLFWIGPVRKVIPRQTFRYAVCGGLNMLLNWILYYISYHYIFGEKDFHLPFVVISPHIAALCLVFPVTFTTGFLMNRYIAFRESPLEGRTQLIRYGISVVGSLLINYACLKILVEAIQMFPTPSQVISTLVVTAYSYLMQKYFTFRGCSSD